MIKTMKNEGIEVGKELQFEHVVSLRKKMLQEEVQAELMKLGEYMQLNQVERNGPMVSTTHGVEEVDQRQVLDMEFLFPVKGKVEVVAPYVYKPKFRLVHAVYKRHHGDPAKLQEAYNSLFSYIEKNELHQITSGYNVNTNEREVALGEEPPMIDVYIGINPSTL